MFLITLSLLGLEFPPAYLFLPVILFTTFLRNRYDFLIQFTILCGAYGFYNEDKAFPFKWMDIALLLSIIAIVIYRRDKTLNKLLLFTGGYFAVLFLLALTSSESIMIQIRRMREYWGIIYFMFPLLIFAREEFDIKIFYRKIFTYAFIIAIFYIIDSLIFGGSILVPRTFTFSGYYSTYYKFYCYPGSFPRKYPPGLFILALCIFPILKFYSLQAKHIIVFALSLVVCRTFSVIGGIVLTFLFFTGNALKTIKYIAIGIVIFIAGYYIDGAMGGQLRIQQLIKQFEVLKTPNDPELLIEFGTGRMAQILPKIAHMLSTGKQYTGFGFLHDDLSTANEFSITNEFYSDVSQSEETVARVEVTQIQTVLDVGLIGLLIQTFYYLAIYFWVLRPLPYSKSYLVVLVCISLFGIGGFAGLISHHGLLLLGLTIGTILLTAKQEYINKEAINNSL
ncbi:MAG: hypothetical protein HPZ82_08980 [Coprobacter sp.]|nr:hypothetical protein [Coprobacter sp.]